MKPEVLKISLATSIAPPWLPERQFYCPVAGLTRWESSSEKTEVLAGAVDAQGNELPLIVRAGGAVVFCFDWQKTVDLIRNEQYPGAALDYPFTAKLPFDYTQFPMWFIGAMARALTHKIDLGGLPAFPQYPLDISSDVIEYLGRSGHNLPRIEWPGRKKYAVTFTHDVDTAWLFLNERWLVKFKEIEEKHGFGSAWYTVPLAAGRRRVGEWLRVMARDGHEIGAHGYDHNPSLPRLSREKLHRQLRLSYDIISDFNEGGVGYRGPWLSRNELLYETLRQVGYSYDSSLPNSDFHRNNPVANNGCGTVFPFLRSGLPVLPVTLPQDAMYIGLQKSPADYWQWTLELVQQIKAMNGVAVVTTHLQPHHSANAPMYEGYKYLIEQVAGDKDAWIALPQDIIRYVNQPARRSNGVEMRNGGEAYYTVN